MVNTASPALSLRDISRAYTEAGTDRMVLEEVNLDVNTGALVAIRGRSGSGKSTLLNIIAGIDPPTKGQVRIMGSRIDSMNERRRTLFRRRHIGFVFQSFNLVPTLTIAENLLLPLELNKIAEDEARLRANTLLGSFSLSGREDSFPDQLSGGEQQRVAIARAIIHRPALVLADEPTGNLDRATESQILDILRRLPEEHGVTLLTATHSTEIAEMADQVLELQGGRLHSA